MRFSRAGDRRGGPRFVGDLAAAGCTNAKRSRPESLPLRLRPALKRNWLSGLVADRGQGLAPRDRLVDDGVQRGLVLRAGLEDAEVLEVGEQRQRELGPHVRDLQLAGDQPQVL